MYLELEAMWESSYFKTLFPHSPSSYFPPWLQRLVHIVQGNESFLTKVQLNWFVVSEILIMCGGLCCLKLSNASSRLAHFTLVWLQDQLGSFISKELASLELYIFIIFSPSYRFFVTLIMSSQVSSPLKWLLRLVNFLDFFSSAC